jgi:FixJ family two-component response regulator
MPGPLTIVREKAGPRHALAALVKPLVRDGLQCRTMIAIVDDDESVRTSLIRFLTTAGFRTRGFASGESFLESSWKFDPPDCLLLDVHMPGPTGLEVHSILNSAGAQFPIIIMSSDYSPSTREQCMHRGALAYLTKPIDVEALLRAFTLALVKPRHLPG